VRHFHGHYTDNFANRQFGRACKLLRNMVRPGGFELPTFWFVARRSIQLSYGRTVVSN
jgi:hypothetical protein